MWTMPVPFRLADVLPGDDAVRLARPTCSRPTAASTTASATSSGKAERALLGRQFVERAVVVPADHVGALHLADDLVAALFLEDLLQRLELGHALDPLLALELLFQPLGSEGTLRDVVNLSLCLTLR